MMRLMACLALLVPISHQAAEPRTLEEALLNYPWEWTHSPRPPDTLIFGTDGVARCERFSWHWKIIGPNKVLGYDAVQYDIDKKSPTFKVELTFDSDFRNLNARTPDGKYHFKGRRLGRDSVKPAAAGSENVRQPAFSMVLTAEGQARIEVIKEQGPNATEWALAPINEDIPADIRQNLTLLREDLLDEGKRAANTSTAAYQLASDYCDKLLNALGQREMARVQAGYQAAQADANKATSNQALDARRNYKMSWPQYAREESQRSALRESEMNKADVKKQRIHVEWATRAEQMRDALDKVYRQLREAMR